MKSRSSTRLQKRTTVDKAKVQQINNLIKSLQGSDYHSRSTPKLTAHSRIQMPGPGQYHTKLFDKVPSFHFGSTPRFPTDSPVVFRSSRSTPSIKRSINVQEFTPKNKEIALRIKSEKRDLLMVKNKETRSLLNIHRNARVKEQYEKKLRKLDYKLNKDLYDAMRVIWIRTFCLVGTSSVLQQRMNNKRRLKNRIKLRISWLWHTCKALGIFLLRLRVFREENARKKFREVLPVLAAIKVRKIQQKFRQCLISVISKMDDVNIIPVIHKWKLQILVIQRNIRRYLLVKNARTHVLNMFWKSVCIDNKAIRVFMISHAHISTDFIRKNIGNYTQVCVKEYLRKLEYYLTNKKRLKDEYLQKKYNLELEIMFSKKPKIIDVKKPRRPVLKLFCREKMTSFIMEIIRSAENTKRKGSDKPIRRNRAISHTPKKNRNSETGRKRGLSKV